MTHRTRHRRTGLVACALLGLVVGQLTASACHAPAVAATKTVYIPSSWASTGDVPWAKDRTRESANFILLWGERSGTDPRSAPAEYRFDPDDILSQLESLYAYYVNTMRFTTETGAMAQYKVDVIITRTWNRTALDAWATGGSADGRVGVMNIAPAAAQPGSWALAHELAHVMQCFTFLGRGAGSASPTRPPAPSGRPAPSSWRCRSIRTAARGPHPVPAHREPLLQQQQAPLRGLDAAAVLVDHQGGIAMFNRIWNEARNTEHPLETYRRITGISQAELGRQIGEYAQRNVTWDYSNRSHFLRFITNVYGAGFLNAYNGVWVDAVNQTTGHYAIPDPIAPSDFGYNKIKLVPSSDGALIRMHFKGHVNSAAQSGWSYGFVAVRNGTPRYGPVHQSTDGVVSFQTQPGESEVYLVVAGTPGTVHHHAFLDGYPTNYRYPYEFRLSGAVPSG